MTARNIRGIASYIVGRNAKGCALLHMSSAGESLDDIVPPLSESSVMRNASGVMHSWPMDGRAAVCTFYSPWSRVWKEVNAVHADFVLRGTFPVAMFRTSRRRAFSVLTLIMIIGRANRRFTSAQPVSDTGICPVQSASRLIDDI